MDLLRREWGYMLYTNLSVESTLLEGFTANGSLSYVRLFTILSFPLHEGNCPLTDGYHGQLSKLPRVQLRSRIYEPCARR